MSAHDHNRQVHLRHAKAPEPGSRYGRTLMKSHVDACPMRSILPTHYREDGSCLCVLACGCPVATVEADGHQEGCPQYEPPEPAPALTLGDAFDIAFGGPLVYHCWNCRGEGSGHGACLGFYGGRTCQCTDGPHPMRRADR